MATQRSLRGRLIGLWFLSLVAAGAAGFLLLEFQRDSAAAQVGRAEVLTARACDAIADRYSVYVAGKGRAAAPAGDEDLRRGLAAVVQEALARFTGVEGGLWQARSGSLAYAFPTYEGTGPKTDVPAAELPTIERVNAEALAAARPVSRRQPGVSQTLLLQACPLSAPELTAWTMTRVFTGAARGDRRLLLGLAILGATVLGSTILLGRLLYVWSRRLSRIEAALKPRPGIDDLPWLERTGERELDRLVDALNAAGERLTEARGRVAAAERLAAVGRLAAGVAHEIRNPIAAMRLKAENALAADSEERRRQALVHILEQIARLDALLRDLLSVTHRREPRQRPVDMAAFLQDRTKAYRELAEARGITLTVHRDDGAAPIAVFDPEQIGRALDNLVLNAVQHTPPGGTVRLATARSGGRLKLRVADTGPGVPPAMRESLFEPFVTGRAEGTGLGLAIVREIAEAHGGHARLLPSEVGALFEIELPCRPS